MVEKVKSLYEYLKGFPHLIVLVAVVGMFLYRDRIISEQHERTFSQVGQVISENTKAIQSLRELVIQLQVARDK